MLSLAYLLDEFYTENEIPYSLLILIPADLPGAAFLCLKRKNFEREIFIQ